MHRHSYSLEIFLTISLRRVYQMTSNNVLQIEYDFFSEWRIVDDRGEIGY